MQGCDLIMPRHRGDAVCTVEAARLVRGADAMHIGTCRSARLCVVYMACVCQAM